MPHFTWTDEAKAEVVKRSRMGFTYAEIATYLGTTREAISRAVTRHKLICVEERRKLQSERLIGKKQPKAVVAKRSRHMKATWADPAIRAERVARRRKACERPEVQAQIAAAAQASFRKRRGGFDLPDAETAAKYRFLRESKGIPAAEAGRILGLLPPSTSQERRA